MPSISAVTSTLVQPAPIFGWPEPAPSPLAPLGKNPKEFLFRRTLPKSEPAEELARRQADKERVSTTKGRADRTTGPQRRERGGGRSGDAEVAAFPGFAGFTPQFLTQFIAQALMPQDQETGAAKPGVRSYQDTEDRANPDMVFGPVAPITTIA